VGSYTSQSDTWAYTPSRSLGEALNERTMRCTKCGFKTSVVDSRVSDDAPLEVKKEVGWYTMDRVYRRHHCKECGVYFGTVEVLVDDLEDIVRRQPDEVAKAKARKQLEQAIQLLSRINVALE
jgi:transcriptional regulator NrdR family protein